MAFGTDDTTTTCTAQLYYGFGFSMPDIKTKQGATQLLNKVVELSQTKQRVEAYDLSSAILYAFTTETEEPGGELFLEYVGWNRVFTGEKTHSAQRHKETGAVSLWAIDPWTNKKNLEARMAELKELIKQFDIMSEAQKVEELARRQAFPQFKVTDLVKSGVIEKGVRVDHLISQYITTDFAWSNFKRDFLRDYGCDISRLATRNNSWRELKQLQHTWREDIAVK